MLDIGRRLGRWLVREWGRLDKAPGYQYQLIERYGAGLASTRPLLGKLPNGCQVWCDLRDHVQRQMWFFGAYEPIEAYLFTRLLQPGMIVIDAGANVGQYSLLAATGVGQAGQVHCFEPVPKTFERLQGNLASNNLPQIRLNQAALWHRAGTLALGLPVGMSDNAGAYSIRAATGRAVIEAPSIKLDDYATRQALPRVDLIKLDIEGAEPFALAGARGLLTEFRPTLLMEVNPIALREAGTSLSELWEQLKSLDYRAWRIGFSAETSGPVADLDGLKQSNVLFYWSELPLSITTGWDLRSALRWARSGW